MRAYDVKTERGREISLASPDLLKHARETLSRNAPLEIRMSGSVMSPAIEDGDIVQLEPVAPNELKPGDIILYHSLHDTAVIHRVIRIERSASDWIVLTRGDAASQNDAPIPWSRVLGRVRLIERTRSRQGSRLRAFIRKIFKGR